MTIHIVLDLETLGTNRNAPILSIGMVAVRNLQIQRSFYCTVDTVEQEELLKRVADEDTKRWWRTLMETDEGKLAWDIATSRVSSVSKALREVLKFLVAEDDYQLWGNSNTFDNEILRSLMEAAGVPTWSYLKDRDFRTLKDLYKEKVPEPKFTGDRHIAINDATHEAKWLILILEYIRAH